MTETIATPRKFTGYQVLAIILLATTQFTVILDFMVMSPLGDMLIKSMHLTTHQFGFAVSGYAFSAGISSLVTAGFADRYDRKKLLLFFYVGFILGTLACGFSTTYPMLLAARILTGIFGGVIGSISMAIVTDLFPIEKRGRVIGFMQMSFGASQVLGIPIGLAIANRWGWQSPFLLIVGLASITWITVLFRLRPVTEHLRLQTNKNPLLHLWHTLTKPSYLVGFVATAFLSVGGYMMMPWGSAFAINNLHVSAGQLPIMFMMSGLASLLLMPLIGRVSDRVPKYTVFFVASLWMMVMVAIYTNLAAIPFWLVLLLNIAFMAGIISRMIPSMALVTSLPDMQDRGAFMSVNTSLQQVSGGAGAALSGLIVTQAVTPAGQPGVLHHYNILGYVMICISCVSLVTIYFVSRAVQRKKLAVTTVTGTAPAVPAAEVLPEV